MTFWSTSTPRVQVPNEDVLIQHLYRPSTQLVGIRTPPTTAAAAATTTADAAITAAAHAATATTAAHAAATSVSSTSVS